MPLRFSNDDMSGEFPNGRGYASDPFVADELAEYAEMMGVDPDDPEAMEGLKDFINKIKAKFKGKTVPKVNVNTEAGTVSVGPEGVNWSDAVPASVPATQTAGAKIADMMKNPLVIGAAVGLVALLIYKSKKSRKKGGKR